jgi:hypothetical protein
MPPSRLLQQFWTAAAASSSELQQGGVLSQIVTRCIPVQQQQCSATGMLLSPAGDGAHRSSRRQQSSFLGLSKEEQELLRTAASQFSSSHAADSTSSTSSSRRISSSPGSQGSSSNSSSNDSASASSSSSQTISASCDVPREHVLHELYHARQQTIETSGSNTALYKLPSRISDGSVSPDEFARSCSAEDHVLSRFYEEGVHGGLGRRFRRKVPLFQVCWDRGVVSCDKGCGAVGVVAGGSRGLQAAVGIEHTAAQHILVVAAAAATPTVTFTACSLPLTHHPATYLPPLLSGD